MPTLIPPPHDNLYQSQVLLGCHLDILVQAHVDLDLMPHCLHRSSIIGHLFTRLPISLHYYIKAKYLRSLRHPEVSTVRRILHYSLNINHFHSFLDGHRSNSRPGLAYLIQPALNQLRGHAGASPVMNYPPVATFQPLEPLGYRILTPFPATTQCHHFRKPIALHNLPPPLQPSSIQDYNHLIHQTTSLEHAEHVRHDRLARSDGKDIIPTH